jgi:hypothetical protein
MHRESKRRNEKRPKGVHQTVEVNKNATLERVNQKYKNVHLNTDNAQDYGIIKNQPKITSGLHQQLL